MCRSLLTSFALLAALACLPVSLRAQKAPVADPDDPRRIERQVRRYLDSLSLRFLPVVQSALARIPSQQRRLLAARYYLNRTDSIIRTRWAWGAEETARFRRSAEYGRTLAELARVRRSFSERNPGYELGVKTEIRTLGEQIRKWNTVRSIAVASAELADSCRVLFSDTLAPMDSVPGPAHVDRFIAFLRAFEPKQVPTVAVPGLSQHGQLRAFDFRIMRGGRLIAGTSTSTIPTRWDAAGWTARLCDAIGAASDRFEGPLDEPYEPWHYTFLFPSEDNVNETLPVE